MKIKSFNTFNESYEYDSYFNEYLVKNMVAGENNELWSIISDLTFTLKKHNDLTVLATLKRNLLNDTKNSTLKIALNACLSAGTQRPEIEKLYNELNTLKSKNVASVIKSDIIRVKVENSLQAEDLKDVLESKPWHAKVKIEGLNLFIDLKNNTREEIVNVLTHLPFNATLA